MGKKRFRMMWVILSVIVLSALVGVVFVNMPVDLGCFRYNHIEEITRKH